MRQRVRAEQAATAARPASIARDPCWPCALRPVARSPGRHDVAAAIAVGPAVEAPAVAEIDADARRAVVGLVAGRRADDAVAHADSRRAGRTRVPARSKSTRDDALPPTRPANSDVPKLPPPTRAVPPILPRDWRVITLTTPPIADEPYTADAAPLSTSMRSTLSSSSVARLVTPDGRPSMSSSERLLMPENCGRNPRMPMPGQRAAVLDDVDAGVLLQHVGQIGRHRALDVGRVDDFDFLRRLRRGASRRAAAVTTTLSAKPPASSTMRSGGGRSGRRHRHDARSTARTASSRRATV